MSRRTREEVLQRVESLVAEFDEGLDRRKLESLLNERFGMRVGSRTLQRLLTRLTEIGTLQRVGHAQSTRYRSGAAGPPDRVTGTEDVDVVPVSPEGADIRRLVRKPLSARTPVGYHPEFLLDYRPGSTWYLDARHRERLHETGRTPAGERPAGTYAREILDRLLIDLSWASSQLEGNTYSRLDTKNLIEYGLRAEGKDAAEAQMILNHKHAIELLVEEAEEVGFNAYTFRNLHAALSENLLADSADEGRLRWRHVQIAGSVFEPLGIPAGIEEQFNQFLSRAAAIPDPFEQALFVLVQIPYLQPFADVNKRVSRIGANLPLIKLNLCPLSFVGVPHDLYVEALLGVYELNRVDLMRDLFVWAYERSARQYAAVRDSLVEPDPFRLRYRSALASVLCAVVQAGDAPRESELRRASADLVPSADLDGFVALAFEELLNLHEGNIARYRIRPGEFRRWRARWKPL